MTRRILIFAGIILFLTISSYAQTKPDLSKKWSLVDCINYALENNIQIKRQEVTAQISTNNYNQSKINLLPNVGAQYNHTFGFGRTLVSATNQFLDQNNYYGTLGIGAELVVFSGFKNVNNILRQKFALATNELQVDKAKDDIVLNIASAYLQILFSKELLQVAKSQLEVTQQQVEKTKKLVEVGNKAMGDLMQIQAQASTEKSNVTTANNNLKFSYLILGQFLDMDSVTNFDIVVPENLEISQTGVVQSVDNVFNLAEGIRPDVKIAENMAKMSEKDLAIARGSRYPTLSFNGQISSYYSQSLIADIPANPPNPAVPGISIYNQIKGLVSKQIGLTLNIPIFNRYSVETTIANSKLNVLDAEFRVRQAKLDLYKAIQQAHQDAVGAFDKFQSSIESVKSNQEAFNYAEQKFNVGMVSSIDYNIAKNNLTKAKSDLVQAKYEFIFKSRILDFYMGNDIKL